METQSSRNDRAMVEGRPGNKFMTPFALQEKMG